MTAPPARLLEGVGEAPLPPAAPASDGDSAVVPERALRCAACGHPVTRDRDRIEVHGAHRHRRVNPSGVDYHVGCFAEAPGAFAEGAPTLHWTWFPGFAWQVAGCRACGTHLGWRFVGERGATFYGLILPRLVE